MEVNNSSGGDTQVRPGTTASGQGTVGKLVGLPYAPRDQERAWIAFAAGATLHLPDPTRGAYPVEFRLPNGRTLVQVVDARTARIELVRDPDGSYRTVLHSEAPQAAAGGRR
jgi:hypothetical protein